MGTPFLSSLFAEPGRPQSEVEWGRLDATVCEAFSPHSPIDEETLFAGRSDILSEMIDVVFQKGCHGIIFGERGVGKTSFANILRDKIFGTSNYFKVVKRSCTTNHDFKLIWTHVFDEFMLDGEASKKYITADTTAYDIFKIFEVLPLNEKPVIIIDEYDRVQDAETHIKMADTIKQLADYNSKATIIIVGVGMSVHQLFGGHPSIHRNVRQKQMPKMTKDELKNVIDKRLPILGMTLMPEVEQRIVDLSQGFPGYTHLLSQNAFRSAVARRAMMVTNEDDLAGAITKSVALADESVKEAYAKAVRSTKINHQYKEALLAFALTETNDRGYFKAADVREPFSRVVGKVMDIPNFARHLQVFQDYERGPVLLREGKPKSYEYRFQDPLLRPYAILAGLLDGLIQGSDV